MSGPGGLFHCVELSKLFIMQSLISQLLQKADQSVSGKKMSLSLSFFD